ncbi:MAG TPA: hypothetical protein VEE83_00815 [Thermoplasmata archaeon]|nr:hypothetical protein [Thermoplasmata archaeon]
MPPGDEQRDPIRATLIAILQQLNRVESMHEGHEHRQTLELKEIERLLNDFWAIKHDQVKVPLALGLLVRNGMVSAEVGNSYASRARAASPALYRITTEGKRFLVDSTEQADRIR